MDTLIAILRSAHCKSTHHYFAIDALYEVPSNRGLALVDLLLANYSEYLKGAKDPDNVFKDFENHVIHVRDGYWGGAAKLAEKWLANSLRLLDAGKWKEAAYAIGVLSHYFTDPFMPLHTAQSPRETIVHRPLEWSVCCAYQEILSIACSDPSLESFDVTDSADWMTDSILRGATLANAHYEALIDQYDMNESRRNPKIALPKESKQTLAQIFTWVITGWGMVLDNIANGTRSVMPSASLTLPTLLAGIQVPSKRVVAAIESAEQRAQVEKILDEYQRTGKVSKNLTTEQVVVRKVRKEKPLLLPPTAAIERAVHFEQEQRKAQIASTIAAASAQTARPTRQPVKSEAPKVPHQTNQHSRHSDDTEHTNENPRHRTKSQESADARHAPMVAKETANADPVDTKDKANKRQRAQLTASSPVVDAPAIGPKTAARLTDIGIHTVQDLLTHEAEEIAGALETRWITPKLVAQWQSQALLACQIERLSAAGAGLLVMAGIRSAEELCEYNPQVIYDRVHAAAKTTEGQRLLRDHEPPPMKTIQRWCESARGGQVSSSRSRS